MGKEKQDIWSQVGLARELLRLQSTVGLLGRVVRRGMQQAEERPRHVQLMDRFMGRLAVLNQIEPARSPVVDELYATVGGWHLSRILAAASSGIGAIKLLDLAGAGYNLPVIPIELAERHCASLPFSSLVVGPLTTFGR